MGIEWHNRKRSTNGRFAKRALGLELDGDIEIDQFHIRLPKDLAERVRRLAIDNGQEIQEFCREAIEEWCLLIEEDEPSGRP